MTSATRDSARRSIGARSYAFGALGGGIRGYELGVVSGALLFAQQDLHFQDSVGIVVAAALIGSLLGAPASGPIADRFGRRIPLAAAGLLYTIGIAIAATRPHVRIPRITAASTHARLISHQRSGLDSTSLM